MLHPLDDLLTAFLVAVEILQHPLDDDGVRFPTCTALFSVEVWAVSVPMKFTAIALPRLCFISFLVLLVLLLAVGITLILRFIRRAFLGF